MAPQNISILVSETCDYITLYGKKDFEMGTLKSRTLRWKDYPGFALETKLIT